MILNCLVPSAQLITAILTVFDVVVFVVRVHTLARGSACHEKTCCIPRQLQQILPYVHNYTNDDLILMNSSLHAFKSDENLDEEDPASYYFIYICKKVTCFMFPYE